MRCVGDAAAAAAASGGGVEGGGLLGSRGEGGEGVGGDAAGERDVVVDEEFEQVVEFVGKGVDGAGLGLGRGEGEGEREEGLVAGCEGDVLQVTQAVYDLCPTQSQ